LLKIFMQPPVADDVQRKCVERKLRRPRNKVKASRGPKGEPARLYGL